VTYPINPDLLRPFVACGEGPGGGAELVAGVGAVDAGGVTWEERQPAAPPRPRRAYRRIRGRYALSTYSSAPMSGMPMRRSPSISIEMSATEPWSIAGESEVM